MQSRTSPGGFTLIELLCVVAVVVLLSALAIPNLVQAQQRTKYARAAADSKTAVTQALAFAMDRSAYPSSLRELREAGYGNISDADPWGRAYLLSPALMSGGAPTPGDDVYVYSTGPGGTEVYRQGIAQTGPAGAVGYSSIYGSFTGV